MALWAQKILLRKNDDPLKPKILLLAHTGKAASLIGNIKILESKCVVTNIF